MRKTSADAISRDVSSNRMNELLQFRATHPIKHQSIDGVEWSYTLSGTGTETILVLSGILGRADTQYRMVINFEEDYRVLSISYPLYEEIGALVDGLIKLLDREGIQRVHFVGTSLGTSIGHVLVRRYPDRINRMVLSTFGLCDDKKLRQIKQLIGFLRLLPYWAIKKYFKLGSPKILKGLNESEKQFQRAYLNDLLDIDKQMMMSQYRLLLDMFENPSYDINQPIDNSSIFIMQSQDDENWNHNEQSAFRQTYPNARIQLFEEGGHLREIRDENKHIAIVRHFLELASA
ncbi:MAG: alpha/beta hydrolase [Cyanobacteria bacterium P01_D01_bin.1]